MIIMLEIYNRKGVIMTRAEANDMLLYAETAEETKKALDAGADVNARTNGDITALMRAKTAKQTELLIAAGADVNARDEEGETALIYAQDIYQEVINQRRGGAWLTEAEEAKILTEETKISIEKTKLLIKAGANVNTKGYCGQTALMYASRNPRSIEQTKLLINAGADVNAKDDFGETALIKAGTTEQTKLLIKAGADVNARCKRYGYTALICAHTVEQAKLLIEAGADVEKGDHKIVADVYERRGPHTVAFSNRFVAVWELVKEQEKIKEKKKKIQRKKNNETKQRLKSKPHSKTPSGVVFADAIAKMKLAGEIKGDVTPARAKKIITKIMRDRALSDRKR